MPPRAFRGPGTKLRNEAPCEQKSFRSRPLDSPKMHFRAFPIVKMLKIFNYEASWILMQIAPPAPPAPFSVALSVHDDKTKIQYLESVNLKKEKHVQFCAIH